MTSALSSTVPIDAIILDMDGTLLDTERLYKACTQKTLSSMGMGDQQVLIHQMVGLSSAKCDALLLATFGHDFALATYHQGFLTLRAELSSGGIALKPGTIELLDALAHAGFPMAIATSSSREAAERHLTVSGLRARFETVVTVDDVREAKPSPDIYLEAARRLGVLPAACIAVEDSAAGVTAAVRAGIATIMVPDMNQPDAQIASMCLAVCPDLFGAFDVIAQRVPALNTSTRQARATL